MSVKSNTVFLSRTFERPDDIYINYQLDVLIIIYS